MVRIANRYIVTKINFEEGSSRSKKSKFTEGNVARAILRSIRNIHGIYGSSVSRDGLRISYINPDTNMLIIRTRRSTYKIVTSSLSTVRAIESEPCSLETLYTGATIRHCNIFLRKYQRRELENLYGKLTTDVQRAQFKLELESSCPRFSYVPKLK